MSHENTDPEDVVDTLRWMRTRGENLAAALAPSLGLDARLRQITEPEPPLDNIAPSGKRAKILLVDDRPENLVALEAVLGALDQTLVRANSGEEALKALLTDDFAVILLDVQMPGLDGFETAAHIKRRERTKDIPIIFLTAVSNGPHHTFRGYAAGAVDYLSKPFDPWILRAKVSVFLELFHKNELLKEQAALLSFRIGDTGGGARNLGVHLVAELSARLAAVEERSRALEKIADRTEQPLVAREDLAAIVDELRARLARLRSAIEAIGQLSD